MDLFKQKIETWVGHKVLLKHELSNSLYVFPKGTLMKITNANIKTIHLQTLGCSCCGLIARICLSERKQDYSTLFKFVDEEKE